MMLNFYFNHIPTLVKKCLFYAWVNAVWQCVMCKRYTADHITIWEKTCFVILEILRRLIGILMFLIMSMDELRIILNLVDKDKAKEMENYIYIYTKL